MNEQAGILITGASGLLGRSLVKKFLDGGWFVFAHYHKNRGESQKSCEWISGDFSTLEKTRDFINKNTNKLKECKALINNYGPITYKNTIEVKSEDLICDFHNNVVVTNEIITSLFGTGSLKSVVNIAFKGVGDVMPYKKILPYAIAKAGVQILTLSYDQEFSGIKFSLVSPPPIEGGEYGKKSGEVVKPESIADKVFRIINEDSDV